MMRSSSVDASRAAATMREPAHDARLADARHADEAGVVGLALGEHVERLLDLRVTPHDRVELAAQRREREVFPERHQHGEALRVELEAFVGRGDRHGRGRGGRGGRRGGELTHCGRVIGLGLDGGALLRGE